MYAPMLKVLVVSFSVVSSVAQSGPMLLEVSVFQLLGRPKNVLDLVAGVLGEGKSIALMTAMAMVFLTTYVQTIVVHVA